MCTERKATGEYVLACFMFATMGLGWAISRKRLGRKTRGRKRFWVIRVRVIHTKEMGRSIFVNHVILSKGWS